MLRTTGTTDVDKQISLAVVHMRMSTEFTEFTKVYWVCMRFTLSLLSLLVYCRFTEFTEFTGVFITGVCRFEFTEFFALGVY
jgi:hypothetical protein